MKKLFLSLAALALTSAAQAQLLDFDGMPPYKLGVTAGINVPSFSATGYEYTIGLNAGADLLIDASSLFDYTYLRGQLKYSMKGATGPEVLYPVGGDNEVYKMYYTTHYIEIPVHMGYSWIIDDDWTLLADTGPYLAIGLGGKAREKGTFLPESHSFFKYYDASHIDFGWGIQAGLMFSQVLMLNVAYDWGFKNITPQFLQNTNLSIGLTVFIEDL